MLGAAGVLRLFTRDSVTYYLDPADNITGLKAAVDEEVSRNGIVLCVARFYAGLRSTFLSGTTGLTLTGTGVGGSAIALDTTRFIMDAAIQTGTQQSLKFTAGNPHSADLYATWPTTAANTKPHALGVLHEGGGSPAVQVQRTSDSLWLQSSGGSWGASPVWITLEAAGSGTGYPPMLSVVQVPNIGGVGSAYLVRYGLPSGGTASRVQYLYHIELCGNVFLSPLQFGVFGVTDAAEFVPVPDRLMYRLLQATGGLGPGAPADAQTIAFKYRLAGLGTLNAVGTLFSFGDYNVTPGNDGWYFDTDNGLFRFLAHDSGTTYIASVPFSALGTIEGVEHRVVIRRTSSHGDLGTAYQLTLFVDGVKSADVIETTHPTAVLGTDIYAWAPSLNVGTHSFNSLECSPYAWTDEECAAFGL